MIQVKIIRINGSVPEDGVSVKSYQYVNVILGLSNFRLSNSFLFKVFSKNFLNQNIIMINFWFPYLNLKSSNTLTTNSIEDCLPIYSPQSTPIKISNTIQPLHYQRRTYLNYQYMKNHLLIPNSNNKTTNRDK
ncbi:hypothetical protein ACTA71_011819 [Dictyostelium dimigraforme]